MACRLGTPGKSRREFGQEVEVLVDLGDDTRSPDLDDHVGPVGQRRCMGLADRRRRQGGQVEGGEHRLRLATELCRDRVEDVRGRHGWRVVLQPGEFGLVVGREQIAAGGRDLPELDERCAEFFESEPEMFRAGVWTISAVVAQPASLKRDEPSRSGRTDQVPEPVAGSGAGDLTEPTSRRRTGHYVT